VHPPGSTFDYNNGDYLILGAILEALYHKPFDVVLRDQILRPLGMNSTGVAFQHAIVPRLATSYFYREDLKAFAPDLPVYPENWHAAGAMYSTVDDLMRMAHGLFDGKELLTPESLRRMVAPGLDDYGYGFWTFERNLQGQAYHVVKRPGQIMGVQTQLYHVIEPDLTVVILSNATTMDLDQFVADIAERALQP
jgi:CubicO group peptidase (beta-lactamase class C family)